MQFLIKWWSFVVILSLPTINCESTPSNKLINTSEATFEEAPYFISIYLTKPGAYDYTLICGGSLISESWVLTALHCGKRKNRQDTPVRHVVASCAPHDSYRWNISSFLRNSQFQVRPVVQYLAHENFMYPPIKNDIMLMKTKKPFKLTDTTKPIKLPSYNLFKGVDVTKKIKYCTHYGRGAGAIYYLHWKRKKGWTLASININTNEYRDLRKQTFKVMSLEACRRSHAPFLKPHTYTDVQDISYKEIDNTYMCTLYYPGFKSICFGDSGSPLVCGGIQFGLTCTQIGCGHARKFATVYTRVDTFGNWIKKRVPDAQFVEELTPNT